MISEQLTLMNFQMPIVTHLDFLARLSALLEARGFEDTRGTLFFEVMRLAKIRKPKYLFAENVAGLLSHDGENFWNNPRKLGNWGMSGNNQVCKQQGFWSPQNRERVFIVDILEPCVRPEYFLSLEQTNKL